MTVDFKKSVSELPDQGKFWDELAEKQRQLYNRKLEKAECSRFNDVFLVFSCCYSRFDFNLE